MVSLPLLLIDQATEARGIGHRIVQGDTGNGLRQLVDEGGIDVVVNALLGSAGFFRELLQ
ncbi:hypothetical protein C3E98_038155 [Pseudomonas sp. MWU13-2625]|nr:hypothetical protein C3E98_038155 [Pseudomonas sp. MWU13-2625]